MWLLLVSLGAAETPDLDRDGSVSVGVDLRLGLTRSEAGPLAGEWPSGLLMAELATQWRHSRIFAVDARVGLARQFLGEPIPGDLLVGPLPTRTVPDVRGAVLAVFTPAYGELVEPGTATLALDIGLGSGVVRTRDDLVSLGSEGDPIAVATERQWHPTLNWAVGPRLGVGRLDLTLQARGAHWIEVFEGVALESAVLLDLGVGVSRRF